MNNTAILSVCAAGLAATVFAANPILPLWECIPDGEPHVFEDPDNPGKMRVYLYGSHDTRGVTYCGRDQVVWSASVDDLNKWRFDGVAFRSIYGADGKQLNKNGLGDVLFAPDVCETKDANGKKTYWLYPNTQARRMHGQGHDSHPVARPRSVREQVGGCGRCALSGFASPSVLCERIDDGHAAIELVRV